jgi:hypothetical protein
VEGTLVVRPFFACVGTRLVGRGPIEGIIPWRAGIVNKGVRGLFNVDGLHYPARSTLVRNGLAPKDLFRGSGPREQI